MKKKTTPPKRLSNIIQFYYSLRDVLKLVWEAKRVIAFILVFVTLVQSFFPIASAWITKNIFDLLGTQITEQVTLQLGYLMWLLIGQALIAVVEGAMSPIASYLRAELSRHLSIKIQLKTYNKINSFHGIAYFENPEIYDTLRLAQQGAQFSSGSILQSLTTLIHSCFLLGSFLGILIMFSPLLVVCVLLAITPELYTQLKFGARRFGLTQTISQEQRQQMYFSYLLSNPSSIKEIRLFNLGKFLLDRVLAHFQQVHVLERAQQKYELRWQLGLNVLTKLTTSGAFIFIIIEAFRGNLSLGDITLFISAVSSIQNALKSLVFSIGGFNEGMLNYSYYEDLMNLSEPLESPSSPRSLEPLMSCIEFRNVSFRYSQNHPWILKDINLIIPFEKRVALVGFNGAGKTTLVKLLTRMYDPTEGHILWDGVDIREFSPLEYRQKISAIFQDFIRYDLTVEENIGIGNNITNSRNGTSINKIKQAAMLAGIHQKVEMLPLKYKTRLSLMFGNAPTSVDLSGGEWRKIALARAYMREADLLILDEPTSSLDPQAENEFVESIMQLVEERTILLISHRFSTVKAADTIAVLHNGKIIGSGSHSELMMYNTTYRQLYELQTKRLER